MSTESHPTEERLADYLDGRLTDVEIDAVAEHLEACEECRSRADRLEQRESSLVVRLRQGQGTIEKLPAWERLMAVARRIATESEKAADDLHADGEVDPEAPTIANLPVAHVETIDKSGDESEPAERPPGSRVSSFEPGSIFGDYEIVEVLGDGGMGVVFRARHVELNRIVALKMIRDSRLASEEAVQRFRAEAAAAAKLDHPGIVPVYRVGDVEGQQFFTMKLVEGGSLKELVASGAVENRRAAELLREVSRTVQFAHSRNIVHRDLKPANVLLDESGRTLLTDFGLAKDVSSDSDLTDPGQVLGTPSYMAPEQAAGRSAEVGPLSDVYACGAILYYLLTGRPPHLDEEAAPSLRVFRTLRAVVHDEPVPVRKRNPEVDVDLATICAKCLEKDPAKRYPSAAELADDLDRYLDGEPIEARSISVPERMVRWFRRNPRVLWGMVATILVLIGAVGYAAVELERAVNDLESRSVERELEALRSSAQWVGAAAKGELSAKYRQTQIAAEALREPLSRLQADPDAYVDAKGLFDVWDWQALPFEKEEDDFEIQEWPDFPEPLRPLQAWVVNDPRWIADGRGVVANPNAPSLWLYAPSEVSYNVRAWWICGPDGHQLARNPLVPSENRDFAYRSYVSGLPDHDTPGTHPRPVWKPGDDPRLSAPFTTEETKHRVIAISAPVFDLHDEEKLVGVVGMFVEVGSLIEDEAIEDVDTDRIAILLDPRLDEDSARIIEHPYFANPAARVTKGMAAKNDDLVAGELLDDVAEVAMSRAEWGAPLAEDPFAARAFENAEAWGGRWRSATAVVDLPGDDGQLIAVVREREEVVADPSRQLRINLRSLGFAIVGLFLIPPLVALYLATRRR